MEAIVRGKYLITDPSLKEKGIKSDAAVYIKDGIVAEVRDFSALKEKFPNVKVIGSGKELVMPGIIDAHSHGRGLSPIQKGVLTDYLENNLLDWAFMQNFPPEITSALCALRHISNGCTTIHNNGFDIDGEGAHGYAEKTINAYLKTGIRLAYSPGVRNVDRLILDSEKFLATLPQELNAYFKSAVNNDSKKLENDYFAIFEDLFEKYNGEETHIFLSPSWAQACTEDFLLRAKETSEGHNNIPIHMHCIQTPIQKAFSFRKYGKSAVSYLDGLGLLSDHTVLAHAIWVTSEDIRLMAERGVSITTHPSCNLAMRNGLAPVYQMLKNDICVAMGMDDKTINDDEDGVLEMRMLHKLHRVASFDLTNKALDAFDVMKCATVNGAKVLGFENELGAIAPGMKADIITVDLERIYNAPWASDNLNVAEMLVHRGLGSDVKTVIVAGKIVMEDRQVKNIDVPALFDEVRKIGAKGLPEGQRKHAEMLMKLKPYYQSWYHDWIDPKDRPVYNLHTKID